MKKGLIIFFAVMAAAFIACGIHCMNSVDVLELQWQGVTYRDALMMDADAHATACKLFFMSVVCMAAGCIIPKHV